MSLLSELKTVADTCAIPVETGVFSGVPPDLYLVITLMADTFELHADNSPGYDTQEARLSLFVKGSYTATKDTPHSMTYRRPGCPISTRGATPNRKMR